MMRERPPVAFLAWSSVAGRPREIAAELGGESRCYYDLKLVRRSLVPVRYLLSSLRTIAYLLARRPRALIITNPPVFVALVAYPYARLNRAPLLLDSHPDAFRSDGPHARFLGIHAWLTRRSRATLVTTDDLVRRVADWGGTGVVVHEPPPDWKVESEAPLPQRPRVLVLGTLSSDEPIADVLAAARIVPEVDIELTGAVRKCPPKLVDSAPANVTFLGFLHGHDYVLALERASIVVVLTTWLLWAVPRSAHDAVYARRPLVLTDSEVLRDLFPFGVPVRNDAADIASGIQQAIRRHGELVASADAAFDLQTMRWQAQVAHLRELLMS